MYSISCNTISPKHGNTVNVYGPVVSYPAWATASASATVGPIGSTTLLTATFMWRTSEGFATLVIPELTFRGMNAVVAFSSIAALPTPQMDIVESIGVFLSTALQADLVAKVFIGVNKVVTLRYGDSGNFSSSDTYTMHSITLKYPTA